MEENKRNCTGESTPTSNGFQDQKHEDKGFFTSSKEEQLL
jgi:hypothetical protein